MFCCVTNIPKLGGFRATAHMDEFTPPLWVRKTGEDQLAGLAQALS